MGKFLIKAGLAAGILMCAFAGSSQASTVLSFTSGACTGAGCGTVSGATGTVNSPATAPVTALSILDFTGFTVSGATSETWTLTSANLLFNSGADTLTLTAGATCTAGCVGDTISAGTSLLTLNLSSAPTYSGTPASGYTISIGNGTSLSENATFLNDLGLATPTGALTALSGGAGTNSGTIVGGTNLNASSTLLITTSQSLAATPEPVSFLLFGTGLCAVGFISRRKLRASAPIQK